MKKLVTSSILLCLLISCSTDSDVNTPESYDVTPVSNDISFPENKANPLDYKGKLYYDALITYEQQNQFPNSIKEASSQLRFISSKFQNSPATNKSIIPFTDEIVASIMADPDNSMILIVENSSLSSEAKSSLITFLQALIIHRESEFTIAYDYIVAYENTIIQSTTWSQDDRDTILTVSSISRYSLYSESERKDRDWETSAGNKSVKPFFSKNEVAVISIIVLLEEII